MFVGIERLRGVQGKLYIKFDVEFPNNGTITPEMSSLLVQVRFSSACVQCLGNNAGRPFDCAMPWPLEINQTCYKLRGDL